MGCVHFGIPKDIVKKLSADAKINTFIETGTFKGDTAAWASSHFKNITTIEKSQKLCNDAKAKHGKKLGNLICDDSVEALKRIVPKLKSPVLFWLDAHWSGNKAMAKDKKCPILKEINIINNSELEHIIMVDDARIFGRYTMVGNPYWPTLVDITNLLAKHNRFVVLIDDVIIAVPRSLKKSLISLNRKEKRPQVVCPICEGKGKVGVLDGNYEALIVLWNTQ